MEFNRFNFVSIYFNRNTETHLQEKRNRELIDIVTINIFNNYFIVF